MFFTMDDFAVQFWSEYADLSSSSPGELLAPLKTLLNTRVARTRAVHIRESLFDNSFMMVSARAPGRYVIPGVKFLGVDNLHHVMLDGTKFFLPLGWRLSERSMLNIADDRNETASLTFELIQGELMGEDTEPLKRPPTAPTR